MNGLLYYMFKAGPRRKKITVKSAQRMSGNTVQAHYNLSTDQQGIPEVNFLLRKWDRKIHFSQ